MQFHLFSILLLIIFSSLIGNYYTEACSCMPLHPQEQYCQADFVILARIRRTVVKDLFKIFKAKIRKEFKMSDKARTALKSGRLQSPLEDAVCGVSLDPGKLYIITGRIYGLQAHVNLCSLAMPWKDVTPRQRKGFRLLYSKGCSCRISRYFRKDHHCSITSKNNCESKHGICLRAPNGFCTWAKSLDYRKCLKDEFIPEKSTTIKPSWTNQETLEPQNYYYKPMSNRFGHHHQYRTNPERV